MNQPSKQAALLHERFNSSWTNLTTAQTIHAMHPMQLLQNHFKQLRSYMCYVSRPGSRVEFSLNMLVGRVDRGSETVLAMLPRILGLL